MQPSTYNVTGVAAIEEKKLEARCKESEPLAATTLAERKRMATAGDFEHAKMLCVYDTAAYMSIPAYRCPVSYTYLA